MDRREFRTLKGYQLRDRPALTVAMEDYLEMIYRATLVDGYARINQLAAVLNVRPSSASKMVRNLKLLGYVDYEKYSVIKLTEKGDAEGEYLLYRHELLQRLLGLINASDDVLEEVERLEHFVDRKTVGNLQHFLDCWEEKQ